MKSSNNKFKGCIIIIALIFAVTFQVAAQRGEFGIRFMPTVSSLDINTASGGKVSGDATLGYGIGAFLGFNFTEQVGIQVEGIYSTITQKYKEQDVENKIKLKYLNIPVLLSLNTGKSRIINLNIVAGPQMGISVGSDFSPGSDSSHAILSVKKGDIGLAYGAGLDFGINELKNVRLGFGFRGVLGLFDISDDNGSTTTESYYVLDRNRIKTYSGYIGLSILF